VKPHISKTRHGWVVFWTRKIPRRVGMRREMVEVNVFTKARMTIGRAWVDYCNRRFVVEDKRG
jgi:hypothetical protein